MGPERKCHFNDDWLIPNEKNDFWKWVSRVSNDKCKVKCKVCDKSFKIDGQGVSQLLSHANGEKHKQKMPVGEENTIFSTMKNLPQQHQPSTSQSLCHNQPSASRTLESSVLTRQVLQAEIRWAFKCISSKYSKRSCDEI